MKKLSIIIIALLAILVCCKKTPEVNIKYVDIEREVLTISQTTATFQCDYQYIATLKSAKLYYGIGEATNYVEMRVVQSTLYAEISSLNGGTTYHYYYEFTNGFNSMQSEVKTFVTENAPVSLPTVITADITEITSDSAIGGGEVTNDGGSSVTARGVCWSTSLNPTIEDSFTTDGNGIGSFVSNLTGLSDNTTYHVRAYATNEAGTAYGLDKEFNTLVSIPEGAINGLFTINENGDQVYFSQGNLQYQASTNTWRFAENQYDYVGSNNSNISSTYNGWIDLFCWGTSGFNHGALCYQPWSTITNNINYYAYGSYNYNLYDQTGEADWGYNLISNGGNQTNQWRTLIWTEWDYVLNNRNTTSGIRYAKAQVNGLNGVVLLPDDWSISTYSLSGINSSAASFNINTLTYSQWSALEQAGAVFLPAAGVRNNTSVEDLGSGYYWSSSFGNNDSAYYLNFFSSGIGTNYYNGRCAGQSVRLVKNSEK